MAQILTWKGDFNQASKHVEEYLKGVKGNRHLLRSALDSHANLLTTRRQFAESKKVFQHLGEEEDETGGSRPHWDAASEAYSRARLAHAEGDTRTAVGHLDRALSVAQQSGDQIWVRRIRASRAQCLGLLGEDAEAVRELDALRRTEIQNPEFVSRVHMEHWLRARLVRIVAMRHASTFNGLSESAQAWRTSRCAATCRSVLIPWLRLRR